MIHTQFTIPLPPSANNMNAGGKQRYNTRKYKEWKEAAYATFLTLRPRPRMFEGPVNIHLKFGLDPKRRGRKPDPDNYVKPVLDWLQMPAVGILSNDSIRQVHHVGITYDPDMQEQMHVKLIPARK